MPDVTPNSPQPVKLPTKRRQRVKLPPYHEKLLEALLNGATLAEAARSNNVPIRTAQRWASRFAPELRRARAAVVDGCLQRAATNLSVALATLHDLASDVAAAAADGATVRRAAASALIDAYERLQRLGDVDSRLNALETLVEQRLGGSSLSPARKLTLLTAGAATPTSKE